MLGAYWDQSASHHVYDALDELFGGSDPPAVEFAKGVEPKTTGPGVDDRRARRRRRTRCRSSRAAASLADAVAASVGADAAFFWQPNVFTKKLLPEEQAYLGLAGYDPARWDPAIAEARKLLKRTPYVDLGDALDGATAAGAVGLRAHERGGRPAGGGGHLREPASRSCGTASAT